MATVRDFIAYDETGKISLSALSLDFKNAFDRISHEYLFHIVHGYGIGVPFVNGIQRMYEGATLKLMATST